MKKKILIKIISLLILAFVLLSFSRSAMASWSINIDNDFGRGETTTNLAPTTTGMQDARDTAAKIISRAISIVQVLGLGIAIIMLTTLGIKYMVGSIEDRVQVKKHATIYVLGAVVFFAAAAILQIVQGFIKANFVV